MGKTIILPFDMLTYQKIVADKYLFRQHLDQLLEQFPKLFPTDIKLGYHLHDKRFSKKMPGILLRRIKLVQPDEQGKGQVFSIVPSGVMPYMSGYTDELEKPLFLLRFGIPSFSKFQLFDAPL